MKDGVPLRLQLEVQALACLELVAWYVLRRTWTNLAFGSKIVSSVVLRKLLRTEEMLFDIPCLEQFN